MLCVTTMIVTFWRYVSQTPHKNIAHLHIHLFWKVPIPGFQIKKNSKHVTSFFTFLKTPFKRYIFFEYTLRYTLTQNKLWSPTQGGELKPYSFFNFGATRGWVVNATLRPLYALGKRPNTHGTGGWIGPKAGLEWCGKSHWDSTPGSSSP